MGSFESLASKILELVSQMGFVTLCDEIDREAVGEESRSDLPPPSFQQWVEEGVFDKVIEALARNLQERGGIDRSECFIDGPFSLAKKGGFVWERTKRGATAARSGQSPTLVVLFYLLQSSPQVLMKSL